MKRATTLKLRFYCITSLLLVSVVGGLIIPSLNTRTTGPAGSADGDSGKPKGDSAPSYETLPYALIDNFSSSLGSDWYVNPAATSRNATFSTTAKPGFLRIHAYNFTSPYFRQDSSNNYGAYANASVQGKLLSMSTFTIETKMNYTLKAGTSYSYQTGLVVKFRGSNARSLVWGPSYTSPTYSLVLSFQGTANYTYLFQPGQAPSVYYLRMTKNLTRFYCYFSTDGVNWEYKCSCDPSKIYANIRSPTGVGVIIRTWGARQVIADFDYFKLSVEGEVDAADYPSTLKTGQTATIYGHMRYYHNETAIKSSPMGLLADGVLDIQNTNASGWATFTRTFNSSGTRYFTLSAINNTKYPLLPLVNQSFPVTWSNLTITARVLDKDEEAIAGATVKLKNSTEHVVGTQTTNATGYCSFSEGNFDEDNWRLNATLNIYGSTVIENDSVTFPLTGDTYKEIVLATSKTLVHVLDNSGDDLLDANVTLCQTSAPYSKIISKITDPGTSWTYFYLDLSSNYNMSIWDKTGAKHLLTDINGTSYINLYWYVFSPSCYEFNVTTDATASVPTSLEWKVYPSTQHYWDEDFIFTISLLDNESHPVTALWVNCSVGSFEGTLEPIPGETGNYTITIPARLIGRVPSGSVGVNFTLSVIAMPSELSYSTPSPRTLSIRVEAVPLLADFVEFPATYTAYYGSDALLWIKLVDNRTSSPFDNAIFSLSIAGNPCTQQFLPHFGTGNYTLENSTAFGLPIGDHVFSLSLTIDNYTLVSSPTVLMILSVQSIPTSPAAAQCSLYDESLHPRSGATIYWNWIFVFNVNYTQANGDPVTGASVLISFFDSGDIIFQTEAVYNSTSRLYSALFDSTVFGSAGSFDYNITASKTGHISRAAFSHIEISWRPISMSPLSSTCSSLKGLFGGESSVPIEVTLNDTLGGSPLAGANVSYSWQYGSGNFTEAGNGVYRATVYADADVPIGQYPLTITANKTYYQTTSLAPNIIMTVDFTGGNVVGIPMTLFVIVLGSVVAVSSIGGLRAYVWATTPYIIKQINRVLRAVDKGVEADIIEGLRTRTEVPLALLAPELESLQIGLTKQEPSDEEIEQQREAGAKKTKKTQAKPEERSGEDKQAEGGT